VIRMSGREGMKKTVRWDLQTRDLVVATIRTLQNEGMSRPWIRSVLYRLTKLPGWTKKHYDTLCSKTGEWRDSGEMEYGLLADDDTGGSRRRPFTPKEIAEQLDSWRDAVPAKLSKDGYLRALLVEHVALVEQVSEWCEGQAVVVSSGGQIRRENLHAAVREWKAAIEELGGKGIKVWALVDWDKGGDDIFETHRKWFKHVAKLDLQRWGVTRAQIHRLGMSEHEDHQIDGLFGVDPRWWRTEIRNLLGIG